MKYYVPFPDWYKLPNLQHHVIFGEVREWLERNIGKQGKDWEYMTGDIHARGVLLPKQRDAVAIKLRFKI